MQQISRQRSVDDAPPGWRCNASTEHGKKAYRYDENGACREIEGGCRCAECVKGQYGLVEGPIWSRHPTFTVEELGKRGYVGLYEPDELEAAPPCGVCQEPITLSNKEISELNATVEVVHVDCLDDIGKARLSKVGYHLGYLIRQKKEEISEEKEDG